jgi:signal transduction histidine kinase
MSRDFFWSLFIFFVILSAFFFVHYIYLLKNGFDEANYLYALSILIPASLVAGYIFLHLLFQKRHRQERRLEHLVREVLHEINLPLSTIEANCEMLARRVKDEKNLKRLSRIEGASKRLQKLYRELAYDIKREIAPIERERFDLEKLLHERVSQFRELKRNPIEIEARSLIVEADRIGLEQVLDNILENAFKYSSAQTAVEISLEDNILHIRDHGIGMDENEILHIYERYYQSDRSVEGEGIGLSIVKRYCDDEKIGLKIVSRKGEGTDVSLDFSARRVSDV